jgi:hypothetical protein
LRTPRRPIPTAEDLPALEVIESDLAKLNVLRAAGRYEEARALAISTAKRAASLGDATSEAMAWLETADLENRSDEPSATETFHQALSVAIREGQCFSGMESGRRCGTRAGSALAAARPSGHGCLR